MASLSVLKSLPKDKIGVAVSGGIDSMSALHFLNKRHNVVVLHYVHSESEKALEECQFVKEYCDKHDIQHIITYQKDTRPPDTSKEEHWRNGRYEFFKEFDFPIVTGHTLDDAVEWYLFSSFHGQGKFMEYSHGNIVRPFLATTKKKIIDYAEEYGVEFIHDVTNDDPEFASRNRIRNIILPEVLKVNPGIYKVVKKRILEKIKNGK